MFRKCKPPFIDYKSSGPYLSKTEDRVRINLLSLHGKQFNRNMLYARYLLAVHLGSESEPGIEVDHIDGDRRNDTIGNLRRIPRKENTKKCFSDPLVNSKRKFVSLKCLECGTVFIKTWADTHLAKGGYATYCSRRCGYYSVKNIGKTQEYSILAPTSFEHAPSMENWEDWSEEFSYITCYGDPIKTVYTDKPIKIPRKKDRPAVLCKQCNKPFAPSQLDIVFCSVDCAHANREKAPSHLKIELIKKVLTGDLTWIAAGKELGISDSGLRKWAKNQGLLNEST